jgi:hypothetical protein
MFYVYEHIRPDTNSVFYVGKGHARRSTATNKRSEYWQRIVAKAGGFSVRIVVDNVDEDFAFLVEMERIDQLRRLGEKLCNMTAGGEGLYGLRHSDETKRKMSEAQRGERGNMYGRHHTEQTKAKMSAAHAGKPKSAEHARKVAEANRGQKRSDETRRKQSDLKLGKRLSDKHKQRLSEVLKGKTQPIIVCSHCLKTGGAFTMKRWHFENCKHIER